MLWYCALVPKVCSGDGASIVKEFDYVLMSAEAPMFYARALIAYRVALFVDDGALLVSLYSGDLVGPVVAHITKVSFCHLFF